MSILGSPHTPKVSEAKQRRAVSGHNEGTVAQDSMDFPPMMFSPESMSTGSSSSRFTSPIKMGTVVSMIAKLAKPVENGPQDYTAMYSNNQNQTSNFTRQYVRIQGPFANTEMLWTNEEEMRKDIKEYDSKQDPQQLMLESLLLDAQTALNALLSEFAEYAEQYKSLSRSSIHVTRSIAKVIGQLTKQTNDLSKSLGKTDKVSEIDLEDLSGIYDEDSVPVQWQEEDLAEGIDDKEFPDVNVFLKWHTALSKNIMNIFSVDYANDLKKLEISWRSKYKSQEHNLCRSEAHYIGLQRALNRRNTLQKIYTRNNKPEMQETLSTEIQNLDRIVHAETILYKGIMKDLKLELVDNQFHHDDVSSLLRLTSEKEARQYEDSRGYGGDQHQAKKEEVLFTSPEDFFAKKSPKLNKVRDITAHSVSMDDSITLPNLPKPYTDDASNSINFDGTSTSAVNSPAPVNRDKVRAGLQDMLMNRLAPPAVLSSPRTVADNSLCVLKPDVDSSIPVPPVSVLAMYGLAGVDVQVQSRAEKEAAVALEQGIHPIPDVSDLLYPVTSRGIETGALKLWHWSPVTTQHQKHTIWRDIAKYLDPKVLEQDYKELFIDILEDIKPLDTIKTQKETYFGLLANQDIVDQVLLFSQKKNVKHASTLNNTSKAKAAQLDNKRSHAISISLGRIKVDYNELLLAVYTSSAFITADLAVVLLTLIPTQEEIKQLLSHKDTIDRDNLGEAETFYYALIELELELKPYFHSTSAQEMTIFERCIRCCIFTHEFGGVVRQLEDQLETVKNAQSGIMDASYSKVIQLLLLSVGNVQNCFHTSSSSRYGFHLCDLSGLSGIKADSMLTDACSVKLYTTMMPEEQQEIEQEENIADQLELLNIDCIEMPMPKNSNLLHFLVKLLYRHDADICSTFQRVGTAYSVASKIEQSSLISSINSMNVQHLVVEHFVTQLNMSKIQQTIHEHGGQFVDNVLQRDMLINETTSIPLKCIRGLYSSYIKLSEFVEYSTLRIQSVMTSLQVVKRQGLEMAELFDFQEAKKAWELVFVEWSDFQKQLSTAYLDLLAEQYRVVSMVKRRQAAISIQNSKKNSHKSRAVDAKVIVPVVEDEELLEQSLIDVDVL